MLSLSNQFLIAMPAMDDPNFERSVTLMCLHDENGALGVVVNRPTDMKMQAVFEQLEIETESARYHDENVYVGGPVEPQLGLVLHDGDPNWESSIEVSDGLTLTMSLDVLQSIAAGDGPERALLCLGYAGWGAGQLEGEMAQNAWLTVDADPDVIFETPIDKRWNAAATRLGVDLSLLSGDVGRS